MGTARFTNVVLYPCWVLNRPAGRIGHPYFARACAFRKLATRSAVPFGHLCPPSKLHSFTALVHALASTQPSRGSCVPAAHSLRAVQAAKLRAPKSKGTTLSARPWVIITGTCAVQPSFLCGPPPPAGATAARTSPLRHPSRFEKNPPFENPLEYTRSASTHPAAVTVPSSVSKSFRSRSSNSPGAICHPSCTWAPNDSNERGWP